MSSRRWSFRPGVEELNARWVPAVVAGQLPVDTVPAVAAEENTEVNVTVFDVQALPIESELPDFQTTGKEFESGEAMPVIYYMMGNLGENTDELNDVKVDEFGGEVIPIFYSMRGEVEQPGEEALQLPTDDRIYTMSAPGQPVLIERHRDDSAATLVNALLTSPAAPLPLNQISASTVSAVTLPESVGSKPVESVATPAAEPWLHTSTSATPSSPLLDTVSDTRLLTAL